MNFNKIIEPFTAAVCKTKGVPMPQHAMLLDEAARRFLFDNVMSELGEYLLARSEEDEIDALVDAIIYTTDTCLRFGIDPWVHADPVYDHVEVVNEVWGLSQDFLRSKTVETQQQSISWMLGRLARGHEFDLTPFVREVAKANTQKIGADGLVTLNERGKVVTPKGFISPDLSALLKEVKNG